MERIKNYSGMSPDAAPQPTEPFFSEQVTNRKVPESDNDRIACLLLPTPTYSCLLLTRIRSARSVFLSRDADEQLRTILSAFYPTDRIFVRVLVGQFYNMFLLNANE